MFASELTRTRSIVIALGQHSALGKNAEIEAYMVQYLTIVFYAEVESKVAELISNVFELYGDQKISAFLSKNQATIISRVKKSELAALAESFGTEVKLAFNSAVEEWEVSNYSNVITARHSVGHGPGVNISLSDVNKGIDAAEKIIATLAQILLRQ